MFLKAIDLLIEKLQSAAEYIKNNKKAAIIASLAFLLLVFVIALLQNLPDPSKRKTVLNPALVVPLVDELLLPEEPVIEYSYELFRKTDHSWTDEQAARWFSEPDGAVFEELQRANTAIVNDILGAVP